MLMQCICTMSFMFYSFSRCWLSLCRCVLQSMWVLSLSEQSHHKIRRSVAIVYNTSLQPLLLHVPPSLAHVHVCAYVLECTLHRIFFLCAIIVRPPIPSSTILATCASTASSLLSSHSSHLVGQPGHTL